MDGSIWEFKRSTKEVFDKQNYLEMYQEAAKPLEWIPKEGDEITIISWYYATIKTPQKGIIRGISSTCPKYKIEIEEDHRGEKNKC